MANKDLEGKHYKCNHPIVKNRFGETVSYTNLTTAKERLEQKGQLMEDETFILNWINATLKQATGKIAHAKKIKADTGAAGGLSDSAGGKTNVYRAHTPKVQDTRSMYAEGLDKEIESIKYLMEYMDNNNKNKLI